MTDKKQSPLKKAAGLLSPDNRILGPLTCCDFIAAAVILFSTIWLFVYCKYGGGFSMDETFYLTIPKRLLDGDGLFTDEWQLSQLSSVLLLPFVWVWNIFNSSTDGIILCFEYIFCVWQCIFAALTYLLLRKYGCFSAVLPWCFIHYFVLNYSALSYNTMGFTFIVLLMCVLYNLKDKKSSVFCGISGFLYALLILCNPVTIVLFPFWVGAVVIIFIKDRNTKKNKLKERYPLFSVKGAISFVIGILPVFVYFLIVLLKNSKISDIAKSIPYILSDSEHMVTSDGGTSTFSVLTLIKGVTDHIPAAGLVAGILLCVTAFVFLKFRRNLSLPFITAGVSVIYISAFIRFIVGGENENGNPALLFFCLFIMGICLCFVNGRKNKAAFYIFICGGLFYTLCMEFTSNLGYEAHVNGYASSLPGTLILLADCFRSLSAEKEEKTKKEKFRTESKSAKAYKITARVCLCILLTLVLVTGGTFTLGLHTVAASGTVDTLEMKKGIMKGKVLARDDYEIFTFLTSDIDEIENNTQEGGRICVLSNIPAGYLEASSLKVGALSAWFPTEIQFATVSGTERFLDYYKLYPENIPAVIYAPFFVCSDDGLSSIYPKQYIENYVTPYFEGEAVELDHGIAFCVTGLKEAAADE